METTIRKATSNDLPALLRFEQAVVDAERPFDRTLKDGRVRYYDIERMIGAPEVRFLVAVRGEELIGCGFARIDSPKPCLRHTVQAYLGLMYVDPRHRGLAVVGKILEELQRWCRSRDIAELRLEVYSQNSSALSAYRKAGFSEHMLEMRLDLNEK